VGTFDGLHLGHREVIRGCDTVLTFNPHPVSVLSSSHVPPLLTTMERKSELIASVGVEELVVIEFDAQFAARSPQDFIDNVLVGTLGAEHVNVGENFRFGARAQGDTALLEADERFTTTVVPMLEVDGEVVSSSHIRGLILGGAVEYADALLGAPFVIDGPVLHGEKRGRTLGFPTANLEPTNGYCTPGHGVYACRVRVESGSWYAAAANIGVRPMFETGLGELIEPYLIDFEGDLYGQQIRVEFLKRLRGEQRFDGVDSLIEQMNRDVEDARAIVAARG
jgi:riboflavin kinase/FMN adenylyltransferase